MCQTKSMPINSIRKTMNVNVLLFVFKKKRKERPYVIWFQTCYSAGFLRAQQNVLRIYLASRIGGVVLNFFSFFCRGHFSFEKKNYKINKTNGKWNAHVCEMQLTICTYENKKKKDEHTKNHEAAIEYPSINANNARTSSVSSKQKWTKTHKPLLLYVDMHVWFLVGLHELYKWVCGVYECIFFFFVVLKSRHCTHTYTLSALLCSL